nr:AIPR family protein [Isoptericola chiayiensis]
MSASNLVELLTDASGGIRKALFFDNVRDFQDFNSVNLEILASLHDPVRRNQFSVLNNGITIVTRELTLAGDDLSLKDFQIVNGCQTCHVLFHAKEQLTDDVNVSVRIIQSHDEDVIAGITAATNRQTAVTDDDLAAREHFHKDLEALFTTFPSGEELYYERRSKQYAEHDIERTRIVTRSQLIRTFASMFLDEPARAGRYVRELKEARAPQLFNPEQNPLAYYTSAAAYYRIEWLLRNKRIDRSYSPARYQLLAAIKLRVLGDGPLPKGNRKSKVECDKILKVIWDVQAAEELVRGLLPIIDAVVAEETPGQPLTRDTVRTRSFTDKLKAKVLALPPLPEREE